MTAKDEVLHRIRAAHRLAPPPDLPYAGIRREYRTDRTGEGRELVDLLVDRLVDYKARVRLSPPEQLPQVVAAALADRYVHDLVVPPHLDRRWLERADVVVHRDQPHLGASLSVSELDSSDGVLTACAMAIAETGTIVLDAAPDQGRRILTLVPDYHLCVVRADQIVVDVPQALARLDPVRATTLISGPSATSDIELNRVEGVHGPRTLEVIVVAPERP